MVHIDAMNNILFMYLLIPSCRVIFCRSLRRPGQSSEKLNSGMILAPLAGIILNLLDVSRETDNNDIVAIFASMDCADTILYGFQYLLEYNWVCYLYSLLAHFSV